MSVFDSLFGESGLTPHGFCLSWDGPLIALHVVSDLLIGVAYYSIPLALAVFVIKRNDLAFRWVFWLFVMFIMACGTTHFMAVWTLWHADYGTEGLIKAVTAAVSVLTAAQLWVLLPDALKLPSPAMLRSANEQLRQQVEQRDLAVAALQRETAERERAEELLRHAQKMEALGALTGGVAHDFNNLLTIIIANLEQLDSRLSGTPELTKYVDRAMTGATRGAALTQQMLAFARRQPLRPTPLDIAGRMRGLAELLRGPLGESVTLEIEAAPELWQVEADPNQLDNALLNLAINARDAMDNGGRLRLTAGNLHLDAAQAAMLEGGVPGDFVVIRVSDTGAGMSPEVRQAAFDPFFTTKPVGQGSGLGLSQVYGFVKQSNGHISLESDPGVGTTVSIYLPRSTVSQVVPA